MTLKQIIRITTVVGDEDIAADRLIVEGDEYIFFSGDVEVQRVKMADILHETDPETGEDRGGIVTIYSRS